MSTAAPIPNIPNGLTRATADIHFACNGGLFKPNYFDLQYQLSEIQRQSPSRLPNAYQSNVLRPFLGYLEGLGEDRFNELFQSAGHELSLENRRTKKGIEEVSEALLQMHHEPQYDTSFFSDLNAAQAIISSLFDGLLLSKNATIRKIAAGILPPLAKRSHSQSPYAISSEKEVLTPLDIRCGIVSFPAEFFSGGLLAWGSLAHEVSGHHFLQSIDGLIPELKLRTLMGLINTLTFEYYDILGPYWVACAEETACDILGVLNIGPSFGYSLLALLRAERQGKLLSKGPLYTNENSENSLLLMEGETILHFNVHHSEIETRKHEGYFGYYKGKKEHPKVFYQRFKSSDKHPLDVLRMFVIAQVIRILDIEKEDVAEFLEDQAIADLDTPDSITLQRLKHLGGSQ
ncbi:hypothetical protein KAR91_64755, partial [Candidatus Pacearchaeota archaeon]|nr:hypothetical protein [Candidatus Pacearchaeota archaeon]